MRGWVGLLLPLLGLLAGCVTEQIWPAASVEPPAVLAGDAAMPLSRFPPRYAIDPPFGEDRVKPPRGEAEKKYPIPDASTLGSYDPFKQFSSQTYYGDDGTVNRHYYLEPGTGQNVATLVVAQVEGVVLKGASADVSAAAAGLAGLQVGEAYVWQNFLMDARKTIGGAGGDFSGYVHGANEAADLMVVKTTPEILRQIDSYLATLQSEIPMIEIQVRVAELGVTDAFQYGLSSIIDKITTGDPFLKAWLTNFNTEALQIAGAAAFPGTLITISGEHDSLSLDAQLQIIQRIADSEILSAPKITVLNGHRAVIVTGDQNPVVKPVLAGNQVAYSYDFKPTGITLVIVPHLLPGNIIQADITAEVSAVTGEETIDIGGTPIQLPIVSKRNIGTKLRVRDGKEFVLGGLYTYSDIEIVSKIPLLGDIPVLGYLFKSHSKSKVKSEILFHILPRVVRGAGGLIEMEQEKPQ